jgi:hypothetical protein
VVSRVGSGLALPDSSVRSLSPADAELIRALAGGSRELWELAKGVSAVTGEPPVTPTNPQGGIGWDWCGPPWGSAVLHPIAWFVACIQASSNLSQPAPRIVVDDRGVSWTWDLWVRPHDLLPAPHAAPYSRGYIAIRSYRTSGAATPTVTIRARNVYPLAQSEAEGQSSTYTGPTGSEGSEQFGDAFYVDLAPGLNRLAFRADHTSATTLIAITSMLLYNAAKRSH